MLIFFNTRFFTVISLLFTLFLASCEHPKETVHHTGTLPVTTPIIIDTVVFNEFVCQIRSFQHIELRALEKGYLQQILVDEGQHVKKGQLLFKIQPTVYQAEVAKCLAEVEFSKIEYENTRALADSNIVSRNELALAKAKLEKAEAELDLARTHLSFTEIRAPFDGIIGKFEDVRLGSLLDEGELLTRLSDNSKMWVYFNVPEATYLDIAGGADTQNRQKVNLRLANGQIFGEEGIIETIESDFNNTTGNIAFRATFQNPRGLLRHGQTGTILWPEDIPGALAIPQKATFEILDKKFVFIVDTTGNIRSREIRIVRELNHIYLLESGLSATDQVLIDGLRKVRSGDKIDYEYLNPATIFNHLELHAE